MLVGITGGTGFIGRRLVMKHLEAGDKVRLLSRYSENDFGTPGLVQIFRGDLTGSSDSLTSFVDGVDVLYHCAGEVHDHNQMHSVHVEGTQKLCIAARNRIGHWVQLSSVGVYGPHFGGVVTESNRLNPQGIYEITKAESDKIITASSQNGFFSYSILRPSIVFGPTMSNQSLFQMIDVINKGFFFYIGEKGASANYIHVNNVVEGLIRCGTLTSAKNQTYVLSDQRTIEEFVAIIANALGRPLPTLRLSRKLVQYIVKSCRWIPRFPLTEGRINALTSRVIYSNSKIEQELKYEHPVIMEDGLREMVQSWNERRRKIV